MDLAWYLFSQFTKMGALDIFKVITSRNCSHYKQLTIFSPSNPTVWQDVWKNKMIELMLVCESSDICLLFLQIRI